MRKRKPFANKNKKKEIAALKKQVADLKKQLGQKKYKSSQRDFEEQLERDLADDFYKLFNKEKPKKSVPKKIKQPTKKHTELEKYLEKQFERLLFEDELTVELSKDIEKIIKREFKKPNYEKIDKEKLRYKGKYISKEFNQLVLDAAKASRKHPQDILDNPRLEDVIDNLIEKNKATTFKTIPALIKYLKQSGKDTIQVSVDGKSKPHDINDTIKMVTELEQEVRKEKDLVYIGIKTIHRIDGKIIIHLPDEDADFDEMQEFLDSEDAEYLIYEPYGE